ncbi:MAG: lmo0937 family membrane protein [Holophaga sp.]|jgi:hypothetical protein
MLWGIAFVFLLLWILGRVGVYTLGAFVHLFLVLAAATILLQLLRGRKAP